VLLRDLTYGLRSLRQSPTFVVTAVVTLGPADVVSLVAAEVVLAAVAAAACVAPTLRAARADPSEILRAS
jgi:hypothetical protein